jgi:hypothetical protein
VLERPRSSPADPVHSFPKAEPFKRWLAKVGYERLQEIADPALALERTRENWRKLGRSEKWITQRMTGQETRNKLTDYWAAHEVNQGQEFAILTNIIHQEWSGVSVKEHKELKGLESQNLRDHMSEAELIFTALAELSTRQIAETAAAVGLPANKKAAKTGGGIAHRAEWNSKARRVERWLPARTICRRPNRKRVSSLERGLRPFSQYRKPDSLEFSKLLLTEAKTAVSPGIGFGDYGDGHVRFSLIENEERTRQAQRGIRQMFAKSAKETTVETV